MEIFYCRFYSVKRACAHSYTFFSSADADYSQTLVTTRIYSCPFFLHTFFFSLPVKNRMKKCRWYFHGCVNSKTNRFIFLSHAKHFAQKISSTSENSFWQSDPLSQQHTKNAFSSNPCKLMCI